MTPFCGSAGGNELLVILQLAALQTTGDDLLAERIQARVPEIRQARAEKPLQDFRPFIVGFFSGFRLRVHLQEPAGDHPAFDLQLMQCVTE